MSEEINNFFLLSGFLKSISNDSKKFYEFLITKIFQIEKLTEKCILELTNRVQEHALWILTNISNRTILRKAIDQLMKLWFCGMYESLNNSLTKAIGNNFIWIFIKFEWSLKKVFNLHIFLYSFMLQ